MTPFPISSAETSMLEEAEHVSPSSPFAVLGGPGARLLAGPTRVEGAENFADHERRLGPLKLDSSSQAELREAIAQSGLLGRGGGQFPVARKLELAASSPGAPLVVVNASEGEPASRKDRTLLEMRPHLVLDGAMVAARAVDANEIVIYLHRARPDAITSLERAIAERSRDTATVRLIDAPARYVAGESSAVVSYLGGTGALPRRHSIPLAASGVSGRPTVVNTAETIAHLALIARRGPKWFAEVGAASSPGSTLVTLAGEVTVPGVVAEMVGPVKIRQLLSTIGGLDQAPRAVLIGGYEGVWLDGSTAWGITLDRGPLQRCGASLGCGVLAILGETSCGLATTTRLVRWLAGESAGQCGPCVFGLPAIADLLDALTDGVAVRRDLSRLHRLCAAVDGRGACGHPSGVVGLVESALETFEPEVRDHLHGRSCPAAEHGFPIPHQRNT